jgi:hypothetical protein
VLDALLRTGAELGPMATWLVIFFAAVVAVFVLYVGIALHAVLRASDEAHNVKFVTWCFVICSTCSTAGSASEGPNAPAQWQQAGPSTVLFARTGGVDYRAASGWT